MAAIVLLVLMPLSSAAPEVRPLNQSTYTVHPTDDYYIFQTPQGPGDSRIHITAPDGTRMTVLALIGGNIAPPTCGGNALPLQPPAPAFSFWIRADGTVLGGTATVTGSLAGAPGDGTFTFELAGTVVILNDLCIGGKAIGFRWGVGGICNNPQLWNQHVTATTFLDTDNLGGDMMGEACDSLALTDTQDLQIQPDEDAANARFFRDAQPNPVAFTNGFMTACDASGDFDSVTMNGDWARGVDQVANTFVRFAHGSPAGTGSLSSFTTLTDDGGAATGSHAETIPYSNAIGNRYAFRARAGAAGPEQSGATVDVPLGLCSSASADDQPKAFTNGFMVTCQASLTVNGNWARGGSQVGNTFVRFRIDGIFTTLVDDGSGVNGDHAVASTYNNALGNQYSFHARADASGPEQNGVTVTVPAGLCTNPNPDTNPHPFTLDSTVTCPSSAAIRGAWGRGTAQTSNTFVRFVFVQNVLLPSDTDLRDNVGADFSSLVDDGSSSNGNEMVTIPYNNVAGNRYQFLARSGATGTEQLGNVMTIPQGQCTPAPAPDLTQFEHDEDEFDITASQAQCAGDQVEFSIDVDSPVLSGDIVSISIIDGDTGLVPLSVTEAQMFVLSSRLYHVNRTLVSGPWVALAQIDYATALEPNRYDSAAFNVPQEACAGGGGGDFQDELDELLSDHDSQGHSETHCHEGGNCVLGGSGTFLTQTDFEGTSVEAVLLVLLIAALGMWMWQRNSRLSFRIVASLIILLSALVSIKLLPDSNLWIAIMVFTIGLFLLHIALAAWDALASKRARL